MALLSIMHFKQLDAIVASKVFDEVSGVHFFLAPTLRYVIPL